jgi:hypothetical protein
VISQDTLRLFRLQAEYQNAGRFFQGLCNPILPWA